MCVWGGGGGERGLRASGNVMVWMIEYILSPGNDCGTCCPPFLEY